MATTWKCLVDWDNTGGFDADGDEITEYVYTASWRYGRNLTGESFGRSTAGTCSLMLDNSDGRFSPLNTESPYYGKMLPNRAVRIISSHGTNLWTYSEELDNAEWVKTYVTVTAENTTAPDGLTTADKILDTADDGNHTIKREIIDALENVDIAVSFYAKKAEKSYIKVQHLDKAGTYTRSGLINILTGSVTAGDVNVTATSVGDGWWRIKMIFNTNEGAGTPRASVLLCTDGGSDSYAGDITKGIYLWGMQAEFASAVGDYDKTFDVKHPVEQIQWHGYFTSIRTAPSINHDHRAVLLASGPLAYIRNSQCTIAVQTDITTGDAISAILDDIDWPEGQRLIDTGQTTMPVWWTGGKRNALSLLREIEETEQGFLRESKDGKIVFEDRAHRTVAPHTTPQRIYTDSGAAMQIGYSDIAQEDPMRGIYNSISASIRPYRLSNTITLWTLSQYTPLVPAGESITLWATFPGTQIPASYSYVAVSSWDTFYKTANAQADGGGADLSGSITITPSKFDNSCKMVIANSSGTPAYITSLYIEGVAVIADDVATAKSEDATSIADYGISEYAYSGRYISDFEEAQDWCDRALADTKDPRSIITITMPTLTLVNAEMESLARDVSDRIHIEATVTGSSLGVDGDYFVEQIQHNLNQNGTHTYTLTCR